MNEPKDVATEKKMSDDADIRFVMSSSHGRRFIWKLLSAGGVYSDPYTPGDAMTTAYRLGEQSFARRVIARLHKSREARSLLRQMEDEHEGKTDG